MQRLLSYFTEGVTSKTFETIGSEVETQFVDDSGKAITERTSQLMLHFLAESGWNVERRKGQLITTLEKGGSRVFYELGRHNMEVSTAATVKERVLEIARRSLEEIYDAGYRYGAKPHFAPILAGKEDLLVIPDERDAQWLELDGRDVLAPLARTSSTQFTFSVSPQDAIRILNTLGRKIGVFLEDFPQDVVWKKYIADSAAGYRTSRYGGPLIFESLSDYCSALTQHKVVRGAQLVPYHDAGNIDFPLYVRSVWWHFRLKRYGNALCVEVRPMARRDDEHLPMQLQKVLEILEA